MTQLEKLLNYVAQSSEGDELAAPVYQSAADSAAQNPPKKGGACRNRKCPEVKHAGQKKKSESTTLQFTMKEIAKMSKTINLRHTFASICGDYVAPQIVAMWVGDSPEELVEKVYIHHSDDKMRAEMNKVVFMC